MEINPRSPDGILDMIGPKTLDGGYSAPSQVISSAMAREVLGREIGVDATIERVGFGANADAMAMITARIRMESLAIFHP